uniref:Uncharacterized protein n=1 Tax=Ralstonia solanacearum TaxID=305 RepID=A0A0S4U0P6_RALSL|nr:protein of unknown function [Ralstonia solanacearum]
MVGASKPASPPTAVEPMATMPVKTGLVGLKNTSDAMENGAIKPSTQIAVLDDHRSMPEDFLISSISFLFWLGVYGPSSTSLIKL